MKKNYLLITGILCILFMASSCCNSCKDDAKKDCIGPIMECKDDKASMRKPCHDLSEEQRKERDEIFEKWDKFGELSEAEQKDLIIKRKTFIDQREAEMKAKKEEFEAAWANFDNLSIEEQKSLIDYKCRHRKGGCMKKGPKSDAPRGRNCPN